MASINFAELLRQVESETLDFKEAGYDLKGARNKFIKDILAMANTPRHEPARIVLGVGWTPESGSTVVGLAQQYDDAEFQNALGHDRVQPIPRFTYTPLRFEGKQVGVLEVPIGTDGPYTPTKDYDGDGGLQAGAIYYRRGTQNDRAIGSEISRIYTWFQGGDVGVSDQHRRDAWRRFIEAVDDFDSGKTYLLAVDRIPSVEAAPVHALAMPPWRAVLDFDPESDTSGLLYAIAGVLGQRRVVHRVVRGEHWVQPAPGIHWFFARGLSGRSDTLYNGDHNAWLKAYKRELGQQLERLAAAISPSPVVVLILWRDAGLRRHLRTLIEELYGALGQAVEVVVVSDEVSSLAAFAEEAGATFVRMTLRSLCSGIAVHFADLQAAPDERCVLPNGSGAPVELQPQDWLWLSEDLELVHMAAGLSGNDEATEFRRGSEPTWRNFQLRHDCDRDVTLALRRQVEDDLTRRQTVRINLYHGPGAGGTTIGRRIAWDLHSTVPVALLTKCAPQDTAARIAKIAALTESSVLLVVDGGQHSERAIDDLYEFLKAGQTPVVLLQVLRRDQRQKSGNRQFWLDPQLTDAEADRFREAYSRAAPTRRHHLNELAQRKDDPQRNPFFFGLTAFGRDFRGLVPYVRHRIHGLTDHQRRILVYLAIAHYYGQQSVPGQAFAPLLGLPPTRVFDLKAAFGGTAGRALDLVIERQAGEWRTSHYLIAHEIMQQVLAPGGSQEREAVWRQNLSSWGKEFARFCRGHGYPNSDRLLELARRVFVYRDNAEVLGTERAAQRRFAHFLEDIPSREGRVDVLRHLTECFPSEAHFHAHLGRFLGLQGEYDEALKCIEFAISIQPDDYILHHMRGMVLRQRMKTASDAGALLHEAIEIAKEASQSFEEARRLSPDQAHGYISEVQMLVELIDAAGKGHNDVVSEVLARSDTEPFLKHALDRAEDLLDRVQHLYAGEEPSRYVLECRARVQRIYGDHQSALQWWDSLLSRPGVARPPVRRQIVWTILRRRGTWDALSQKEASRIQGLLEDNLEEDVKDSTSLRLWLRAIRLARRPPSLDSVIEKVGYWKGNTGALEAAYYLYVLQILRALEGSAQSSADAERSLEECRLLARLRRDRTRSFEWIGPGNGIASLVHQSHLGEWKDGFWERKDALARLHGRIASIDGPQRGYVELDRGVKAFFVPAKGGFYRGRDENTPVMCYVGFSYDGPQAWDVSPAP